MPKRLIPLILCAAMAATPALADRGGKAKGPERAAEAAEDRLATALISAAERALIQDYFGRAPVRAEGLPPGIAKNVARGKPLPPGIARQMPSDLQARLQPPPGHVYQVVGADVVLLNAATNVVVEVLRGMLR